MNYIDVYLSRVNFMGDTKAEKAKNQGIRDFEVKLAESPHRVDLSVERGLYFPAIILSNKEDENKKTMLLDVAVDIPLKIGDIVNWRDGETLEKWIIYQKQRKVNEPYQTFYIVRCNYYIKWVDDNGHLRGSWSYLVSSMDSKIKGNYRTWNNLITPQPNKYLEMLIPDTQPITKGTRFLINAEGWLMIEYDNTSVPGINYISLTEEKINYVNDDRVNEIADADKLAVYKIVSSDQSQSFSVGDVINPIFTVMKNGIPYDGMELELISSNKKIVKHVDGILTAVAAGEVEIEVRLKQFPEISNTINLTIGEAKTFSAYIDGQDSIKLNRSVPFTLVASDTIEDAVQFELDNTELASIIETDKNYCVIKANQRNKLGSITLTATYNGISYSKEIKIVPLW